MVRGAISLLLVGAFALTAAAQDERTLDELIAEGQAHRVALRDAEALAIFEECVARWPESGQAIGQVGLAEMALGRVVAAETNLLAALRHDDDPWVRRNRAELEDAVAVVRTRTAVIEVPVPNALITVDANGRSVTRHGPATFRVGPGTHTVRVEGAGFATTVYEVSAVAGQRYRHTPLREALVAGVPPSVPTRSMENTDADSGRYRRRSIRRDVLAGVFVSAAIGTTIGAAATTPDATFTMGRFLSEPRSTTHKALIGLSVGLAVTGVVLFIAARVARAKHRQEQDLYEY